MALDAFITTSTTATFFTINGNVQQEKLVMEEITRPATRGVAYRQQAARGEQFDIDTISLVANATSAAAFKTIYFGLVGEIADIRKQDITYEDYLILSCSPITEKQLANGTDGNNYRLDMRWTLRYAGNGS